MAKPEFKLRQHNSEQVFLSSLLHGLSCTDAAAMTHEFMRQWLMSLWDNGFQPVCHPFFPGVSTLWLMCKMYFSYPHSDVSDGAEGGQSRAWWRVRGPLWGKADPQGKSWVAEAGSQSGEWTALSNTIRCMWKAELEDRVTTVGASADSVSLSHLGCDCLADLFSVFWSTLQWTAKISKFWKRVTNVKRLWINTVKFQSSVPCSWVFFKICFYDIFLYKYKNISLIEGIKNNITNFHVSPYRLRQNISYALMPPRAYSQARLSTQPKVT